MTKKFKHSGTLGDIVYGLALMKHFGGGEFYLHLNQVEWIAQHYYKSKPPEYHRGRMNEQDFEFIQGFFEAQDYITQAKILNPNTDEITHNLDRFRPLFTQHPSNYINTYCMAFGITDTETQNMISGQPWLTVPEPIKVPDKFYVINRTSRGFAPTERNPQWDVWREDGVDTQSIFIGLPQEYEEFKQFSGWDLDYYPTKSMMEMAQVIAGSEHFIGNQSVALAIAQGLGVAYIFEMRRDLPLERNESYFPNHGHGSVF